MKPELTIAIPTYERPGFLASTIDALLPQLDSRVELLVLDNHSPTPASEVINARLRAFPSANVRVVRHAANIGGNANILRCIECAMGEWVWTLGDDDHPASDAIAQIRTAIIAHPDADHFNFCTTVLPTRTSFRAASLDEFLDRCDSFSNALFISANIYRREHFVPYLSTAFNHSGTNMAQIVILLAALQQGRVSVSVDLFLVGWETTPMEQRWPHYFYFQFMDIVQVLPDCIHQRKFLRLLDVYEHEISPWSRLRWAILSQFTQPEHPSALLFVSRGADLRATLQPRFFSRLRWRLVASAAGFIHRHQLLFMNLWRLWHRLRHRQPLRPTPHSYPFKGHHHYLKTHAPRE